MFNILNPEPDHITHTYTTSNTRTTGFWYLRGRFACKSIYVRLLPQQMALFPNLNLHQEPQMKMTTNNLGRDDRRESGAIMLLSITYKTKTYI